MGCGKSTERVTGVVITPAKKEAKDGPATATLARTPVERGEKDETDGKAEADVTTRTTMRPGRLKDLEGVYRRMNREAGLRLEYVYGYNSASARQNIFYLSASDLIVYPCGSICVLLSVGSNTQKFLGGGEVYKANGHFGDVSALTIFRDRDLIATGECSPQPLICIWELPSSSPHQSIDLPPDSKGTAFLSFSSDAHLLASLDLSPDQTLRVHEVPTGKLVFTAIPKPGEVAGVSWSPVSPEFVTAGKGHFARWSGPGFSRVDGGVRTEYTTVKHCPNGDVVTGGADGKVYRWRGSLEFVTDVRVFREGAGVTALAVVDGKVVVGGKESKVRVLDATDLREQMVIDTPGVPVSVDYWGGGIVCGTQEGVIVEFGKNGRAVLMDCHSDGEVSGIAFDTVRPSSLLSIGSDNKVKCWDLVHHKCAVSGLLEVSKSSSQPTALAISGKGHIAIGHDDGHFTVRMNSYQLNNILAMGKGNKERITALKYSPDSSLLALASLSGSLSLYSPKSNYTLTHSFSPHSCPILSLDFSTSSIHLRSQDSAFHLSYLRTDTATVSPDPPTRPSVPTYSSESIVIPTQGNDTRPTCSSKNSTANLFAQGTENGIVELVLGQGATYALGFKAHGKEVRRVAWSLDGTVLMSAGGTDMAIMQWKME